MQYTDVVIIGAGPVGLFTIFQCGMMKLKCHVIDALPEVGGQCTALYPEKPIYDIPAFPQINAGDLIANLKQQAAPFNPTYHLGQQITSVDTLPQEDDYNWCVTSSQGIKIYAKVIIIAAGVGAFGPNKPPLDNLEDFEARSIHYFVRQRETYRDKKIVIAGGGDSAVDWAISLSEIAQKVYVVHRRAKFRAAPDSVEKLHHLATTDKLELVVPYQLAGLDGTAGQLQGVRVATLEGQERVLEADYLLPFFGLAMNLGPIATWGLNLDKSHIAVNPTTAETSTKGIFAVGDVATYENKLKLILCGFAEAASAAHKAREIVYPGQAFHFEYSTTSGVPGQDGLTKTNAA
jgi:thioredoxin reductase (NADPH)